MSRIARPAESAIRDWYNGASLVDSFAVTLPPAAPTDIGALAALLLPIFPSGSGSCWRSATRP